MNPLETFQQMSDQLLKSMPEPVKQMSEQAQNQMREAMAAGLANMDLVSRKDFEAQASLLARAESRLADLETRLAALESQHHSGDDA